MRWQITVATLVGALLPDLISRLTRSAPPVLIGPYLRLWKEFWLLRSTIHKKRFSNWKPRSARFVTLQAIRAGDGSQESAQPVLDLLESFLKRGEPIVLLGEPGAGKTTALEALTYSLAKRANNYNSLIWIALLLVAVPLGFVGSVFSLIWFAAFILWEPLVRRFTVPLYVEARSSYIGGD